jgi:hypothetical protein
MKRKPTPDRTIETIARTMFPPDKAERAEELQRVRRLLRLSECVGEAIRITNELDAESEPDAAQAMREVRKFLHNAHDHVWDALGTDLLATGIKLAPAEGGKHAQ